MSVSLQLSYKFMPNKIINVGRRAVGRIIRRKTSWDEMEGACDQGKERMIMIPKKNWTVTVHKFSVQELNISQQLGIRWRTQINSQVSTVTKDTKEVPIVSKKKGVRGSRRQGYGLWRSLVSWWSSKSNKKCMFLCVSRIQSMLGVCLNEWYDKQNQLEDRVDEESQVKGGRETR